MSIKKIQKDGTVVFRAHVCVRSSHNPQIKVQRQAEAKTEKEAIKLEKHLLNQAHAEVADRERAGASWRRLVEDWERALSIGTGCKRTLQKTTAHDHVTSLHAYTSHWMPRRASSICPADVREVFEQMSADGKSRSRIRSIRNSINLAFIWGIETRRIPGLMVSPVLGVGIHVAEQEKRPDILTLDEIKILLRMAQEEKHIWYPIWAAALLTGMRSGELYALRWEDVDFDSKTIRINKSYNGRTKAIKSTKSGAWRDVPINSSLEALLRSLKATSLGSKEVLPRLQDWSRGEAARILRAFCMGIGIRPVKFHALRACFATHLLRDNVAPVKVMKMGGWKDLKTMQIYTRLAGIDIQDATKSLQFLPPEQIGERVVSIFGNREAVCPTAAQQGA